VLQSKNYNKSQLLTWYFIKKPVFSAFSLESNALKGPLWLAGWLAASKTRRRKHVETSGFLH